MRHIFLLIFVFISSCATSRKFTPADLLIPIDKPIDKPLISLTDTQVRSDVDFLIYALDKGYAGRDYIPAQDFEKAIRRLGQIQGTQTPESLKESIDEVLLDMPDSHIHARLNNKWSKLREGRRHKSLVGNNFYLGSDDKPWKIDIRKIKNKSILLISITSFPFHESSVWDGFLQQVQKKLTKASALIIDMRGNGGGDDTIGLQLAWVIYGKNYKYPLSTIRERKTPETQALFTNMFGYQIAKNLSDNKKTDDFVLKRYQKHKEKFDKAVLEKSEGYSSEDISMYEWSGDSVGPASAFNKPVYILMDQRCASSCESTIDAFEFYPKSKKIGENTAGYIHFGNVSPIILPHSKILVQIGTHYADYGDHRFIEKVGIKPDIKIIDGQDALEFTLKLIQDGH